MPPNLIKKFENYFFYAMDMDKRIEYCRAAKDSARFDEVTPIKNVPVKYLNLVWEVIVIKCETLPICHVYKPNDNIEPPIIYT